MPHNFTKIYHSQNTKNVTKNSLSHLNVSVIIIKATVFIHNISNKENFGHFWWAKVFVSVIILLYSFICVKLILFYLIDEICDTHFSEMDLTDPQQMSAETF